MIIIICTGEPRLSLGAGIRDLERRTAEVPTILRNNLQNVIDELRPIVERARSSSTDAGNTELPWFAGRAIAAGSRDQIRTESNVPVSSSEYLLIRVNELKFAPSFIV